MLRLITILLFVFTCSFNGYTQTDYSKKYYFAVGIFVGAHSQIMTYAIITESGGRIIGSQIVREQRFMYNIMGYWPTPANPKRENLLEKNGVDSCFLTVNYSNKINGYYIKPFHSLWKIRYKIHPIAYDTGNGWSQEYYKPSPAQARFLDENYGVQNIKTQYIYGDSLYKLLRDVQNPDWVIRYSTLSDTI